MATDSDTRSDSVGQDADKKLATLKMTLKADSGFRSQSEGDRISANQWRDIMLVIADAEAYRKMRAADDMLAALRDICAVLGDAFVDEECDAEGQLGGYIFGDVMQDAFQAARLAMTKALPTPETRNA